MKPAPLALFNYFVEQLTFSANIAFDPDKPITLDLTDLRITSRVNAVKRADREVWEVCLQVVQNVPEDKNAPYNFSIVLIGHFEVDAAVPADRHRWLVETNGRSILYGTCREVIRATTAQGPYQPLLLPTLSFYENPQEQAPAARVAEEAPR